VLPAEDVAGRPPGVDVRVRILGDERPLVASVVAGEHRQFVQSLEREAKAALGAVDGDGVVVLVAWRDPGRLERAHRAALELDLRRVGVVGCDRPRPVAVLDGPLVDEGPQLAANTPNLPDTVPEEEPGQVDGVGAEVAQRTAAGEFRVVPPGPGFLRVDQPVLEVPTPERAYLANRALLDERPGALECRHEPVVEPHAGDGVALPCRVGHLPGVLERVGERLLTEHVDAAFQRLDGWFRVEVVRAEVVEDVDVLECVPPVGRRPREAEPVGGRLERPLVATYQDVALDRRGIGEEHRESGQGVGVRVAHEPVAEEAYPEGHVSTPPVAWSSPARQGVTGGSRSVAPDVVPDHHSPG
jgi:hypothetical protein